MKREGSGSRGKGRQTHEACCSCPESSSNSIKIFLSKSLTQRFNMLGFDSLESYALMSSGVTRIKNTDLVEKNWVEIRKPYLVTKYSSSLTFDVPWIFSGNEGNYLPGPVVAMLPLGDRISFFIFIDSRLLWNRVVGMASYGIDDAYSSNPESSEVYVHERNSSSREGMQEVESTMEVLTRVDCDLAYSSEKLVNLHVLLVHLLAQDNNLEARMATENSYILAIAIEKALAFDLLSGILDSEVREVENFMENIQSEIVDARHKISSCRHSTDLFTVMENKLHNSEESLIKFREHVLEVKAQSAKLPMAFSASILENWKDDKATELPANGHISNMDANSKRQTAEKQRNVLRMLDKSLKREMDVQKKISALKQNEEHLELKLHYTKQVSFRMEEAAEVVWGRFLEAENASEVLMGISKEMAGRLQIFQFTLNGSIQREDELSSKMQDCIKQRDAKDTVIKKLESSIAEHIAISSQVPILMEKVKSLEEQLKKSELRLQNANALNAESQEHLSEMENLVESLKESIYEAETRAETAETKATQLTDTNVELVDEINFLKGSRDSSTKKVTVLEKQLRESEIQLQHAKASSEVSQEQQNMLYSAIWDMETLIDDLRSKVSKAESNTDGVEEQCIVLSESNMELNKEISFLRSRVNALEMSLDEANYSKDEKAKEISVRTELIMDTVMQLTRERERIQNQLFSLTKENEILAAKLRAASLTKFNNGHGGDNKLVASKNVSLSEACE
ncbi:hypothetical protein OIU78_004995 [Salix suchowensis]|nr:hypothetical protein OIU78_004995 [Salix suchowensis]